MLVIKVKSDDCIFICFQMDTVYIKSVERVGENIVSLQHVNRGQATTRKNKT